MSSVVVRQNSNAFLPTQQSGLAIWLDASKIATTGGVSPLTDQSGGSALTTSSPPQAVNAVGQNGTNGANGVITMQSPNGLMVMSYTPILGFHQRAAAVTSQYGHTTFAVVQSAPKTTEQAFWSVGGVSDGYQFGFLNKTQRCIRTLGTTVLTTTQIPSWGWEIWTVTCDSGHNWTLRVNGIPQTLSATTSAVVSPSASSTLGGAFPNGGPTTAWNGLFGELFSYTSVLSASTIAAAEAYLAGKWWQNLPQIICEGNSIVAGGNGTTPQTSWPAVAAALLGSSYTVTNNGIGGQTTPQLTTTSPTLSGSLLSKFRAKNICVGLEFTNDILTNGASNATAQANYAAWIAAVIAWGGTPVACTYPPLYVSGNPGFTATYNANRAINNAWVRSVTPGLGCVAVVDFAANPTIGPDAAATNPALLGDGLHYTPLACQTAGQVTATVLSTL